MSEQPHHVTTFSTDMLPERERFDAFVEHYARRLIRVDVRPRSEGPFLLQMRSIALGMVRCYEINATPVTFGRTRSLITDGDDHFIFKVCSGAPLHDSLSSLEVRTGEGVLLNNSASCDLSNGKGGGGLSVMVPRKTLLDLVPNAEDLARVGAIGDCTELRLLRGYITALLDGLPTGPSTLQLAGKHMIELVALALGRFGEMQGESTNGGLRAARSLAVRQTIAARLHEHGLVLPEIAKDNAISERYVQRLFEDIGTSFSEYLLAERLEFAHRLLLNPLHRGRRIADIALDAGFGDLSHFNRSFRRRFGDTPSGVRDAASSD